MSEQKVYSVVLVDYSDSWNVQDDPEFDYLWTVATDSPAVEEKGFYGFAIYEDMKIAQCREGCILDHGTRIESWTEKEVQKYINKNSPTNVYLMD